MFGSAKSGSANGASALTGVERAKLERGQEPLPDIDDVTGEPVTESVKAVKKGFSFPEKAKTAVATDSSAHLYIGANIRLKGEITGCDMMRIEGVFEGTSQARQLVLCPGGSFIGIADVQDAEIEGTFEGTLSVRGRLYLRNKGCIRGTFSYGQLEIERGGEVEGRIVPHEAVAAEAKAKLAEPAKHNGTVAAILAATPPAAPRPVQSPVQAQAQAVPTAQVAPKPAAALNGSGVR